MAYVIGTDFKTCNVRVIFQSLVFHMLVPGCPNISITPSARNGLCQWHRLTWGSHSKAWFSISSYACTRVFRPWDAVSSRPCLVLSVSLLILKAVSIGSYRGPSDLSGLEAVSTERYPGTQVHREAYAYGIPFITHSVGRPKIETRPFLLY